jgi:hypothetical protein
MIFFNLYRQNSISDCQRSVLCRHGASGNSGYEDTEIKAETVVAIWAEVENELMSPAAGSVR